MTIQQQAEKYASRRTDYVNSEIPAARVQSMLEDAFIAGSRYQSQASEKEDYQAKYAEALEWIVLIAGPLRELVEIKKMKDANGKTPEYEVRQPMAWESAFRCIDLLNKDNGYFKKLPGDIVERLDTANPHRMTDGKKSDSWKECCAKLRELLSQHPATEQKQGSAGVWVRSDERLPEKQGTYIVIGLNNKNTPTPPNDVWFSGHTWIIREGTKVYYWLDESNSVSAQVSLKDHAVGFGRFLRNYEPIYVDLWKDREGKFYGPYNLYNLWLKENNQTLRQQLNADAGTIKRLMEENEQLKLSLDIAQGRNRELVEAIKEINHHIDIWPDEPKRAIRLINIVTDKTLNYTP